METQKLMDFDFKKIMPMQGSETENKISRVVTKKFLLVAFAVALGFGMGNQIITMYSSHESNNAILEQSKNHSNFVIAQKNKESIINNLENQVTMYDDIIKDIFDTNKKLPNSAQTILNQNTQIRTASQSYKEYMIKVINNFNDLTESEEVFKTADTDNKALLLQTIKNYQSGNLSRQDNLEAILMQYCTIENDEKDVKFIAQPMREELKKIVVEKMSNLLGSNEITKTKKLKIK